jgi:hypothetical protein
MGRNSMREGGTGLFVLVGAGAAVALLAWARGTALRQGTPYHLTVELPLACGVTVGTPLRIRGVQVCHCPAAAGPPWAAPLLGTCFVALACGWWRARFRGRRHRPLWGWECAAVRLDKREQACVCKVGRCSFPHDLFLCRECSLHPPPQAPPPQHSPAPIQVGQVLNVVPSLSRVDVLCEVNDVGTVIPRNSVVEANQSGLIAEPLLDVTPQVHMQASLSGLI